MGYVPVVHLFQSSYETRVVEKKIFRVDKKPAQEYKDDDEKKKKKTRYNKTRDALASSLQ